MTRQVSVWSLQRQVSRHLLVWSAVSVGAGGVLLSAAPFWRGVGLQGVVWGAIDAGIALFGLTTMRRRQAALRNPDAPQTVQEEARKLRRLLRVNAGLDVLYIAGGSALTLGATDDFARGNGLGIVLQGGFLLLFDLFYARRAGRRLSHDLSQTA